MALSITQRGSTQGTGTTISVGPFTPADGSILVARITYISSSSGIGSVSGGGLTWVAQAGEGINGWETGAFIYTAIVGTGQSTTVEVSPNSNEGATLTVWEISGQHDTTPIRQTFTDSGSGRSGSYTGNFASAVLGDSYVLAAAAVDNDNTDLSHIDTGSGYTQDYESGSGSFHNGHHQSRTGSTSTAINYAALDTAYTHVVAAIELAAGEGGGPAPSFTPQFGGVI